jgi:hypothetical protein
MIVEPAVEPLKDNRYVKKKTIREIMFCWVLLSCFWDIKLSIKILIYLKIVTNTFCVY